MERVGAIASNYTLYESQDSIDIGLMRLICAIAIFLDFPGDIMTIYHAQCTSVFNGSNDEVGYLGRIIQKKWIIMVV